LDAMAKLLQTRSKSVLTSRQFRIRQPFIAPKTTRFVAYPSSR
jgi:hypothetical protein